MKSVAAKCMVGILFTLACSQKGEARNYTDDDDRTWYTWKTKWHRKYAGEGDEEWRKGAYFKNDEEIQKHNTEWFGPIKPSVTHFEVINMFADTTAEEWTKMDQQYPEPDDDEWGEQVTRDDNNPDWDRQQAKHLEKYKSINNSWASVKAQVFQRRSGHLPFTLDWRRRVVVPDFAAVCCMIDCTKSTYAWAVAVTLISHQNIRRLTITDKESTFAPTMYSIQQLIDCLTTDDIGYSDVNLCKSSLLGGNGKPNSVVRAYKHVIMNGIMADEDYRFREGNKSPCLYHKEKAKHRLFTGYMKISRDEFGFWDEIALIQALAFYGPVTVSFNANRKEYWRYSGGILDPVECKSGKTVSMVLVGYGFERNTSYWLLMAPWGERFGRYGMIKIKRFSNNRECSIARQAIFPMWEGREEVKSYDFEYWQKLEESRKKYAERIYVKSDLYDDTFGNSATQHTEDSSSDEPNQAPEDDDENV